MKYSNFIENGIWLKGNLHAHSTNSDGDLAPEQVIKEYKERNYQFLSITDHNIFTTYPQFSDHNFIMIPGLELSCYATKEKGMHLNIIQKSDQCDFTQNELFSVRSPEETVEFIKSHHQNYIVILNHPYWSLLEWEEVIDLQDVFCMEVYNHGSEWLDCVGEASKFWDTLLRKGKKMWGLATDDNHNGYKHIQGWPFNLLQTDSFGGYIMVKAKEFTHSAIMQAIMFGSFYSSTGPEIYDFYVEDGEIVVNCSPCERIIFSGDRRYFQRSFGVGLTHFRTRLKGAEKYVRVQCIDKYGKTAYGNPIYL